MVFDAVNNAQCNAAQSLNQRSVVSLNLLLSLSILLIVQFMLTFRQSFLNFDPPATTDSSSSSLTPLHNNPIIASLMELTQSNRKVISCPSTLMLVNDSLLDPAASSFALRRKIPRIVHVSSGSRCNDQIIAENLDTWRLQGHFFFLHDDDAVLKLLHQDWPEFPLLRQIMTCIPGRMGAAWIDLWRLLVLWKYGGIYADLDTSPVPSLFNETTISEEDDAFFVVDQR
jgi:mannosyltransferase OCH1-like enzyme